MNAVLALVGMLLVSPLRPLADPCDPTAAQDVSALRAEGPAALERLLARYDALAPGGEKEALDALIDAVAKQRYATFSRFYWYTDLAAAESAARATGKPILSLRMLGRLDDELSCANSRLFRVVLYADAALASFLRDNFVLHWSSERPVPRVTIDFGDGRKIETTVAGNSAHFVLDADGRPIDVLPGLYSARAFRRELEASLPLARESPSLSDAERDRRVKDFHGDRLRAGRQLWAASGEAVRVDLADAPPILLAETRTVGKALAEMPLVRSAHLGGARADGPVRASIGSPSSSSSELWVRRLDEARIDDSSRALVARLAPTDWSRAAIPLRGEALEHRIEVLEALVAADTEDNETLLHARIHGWFASSPRLSDFESLDERVYRELFLSGRDDAWLGLSNPGAFDALPHDGIVR